MKKILLFAFTLVALNAKSQWINSLTTIPLNPTTTDSVYLIADCSFPSGSCDQHTQGFGISGNNINAWALHCIGMLAMICDHVDTFSLGMLPAGVYISSFHLDHGLLGTTPCTAGIVPGPTTAFTFIVSTTTDIPNNEPENKWVTVFPNPASEVLHIKLNSQLDQYDHSLSLYDIYGKKVWELKDVVVKQDNIIETKHFAPGLYLLKMGTNTQKIVIK